MARKVTGLFLNGHKYEVEVRDADWVDFEANYIDSLDDGFSLDPNSIEISNQYPDPIIRD
jgi:hypothetical protein